MSYSDSRVDEVLKLVDEIVQVEPVLFQLSEAETSDQNPLKSYVEFFKQMAFDFTGGMRSRL